MTPTDWVNIIAGVVSILVSLAVVYHLFGNAIRSYLTYVLHQAQSRLDETAKLNRMWEMGG